METLNTTNSDLPVIPACVVCDLQARRGLRARCSVYVCAVSVICELRAQQGSRV
jgi:hypothetical protein